MSRCFPYPPPGYARKVVRTEAALIESIKLQSQSQQCKTDKKKENSRHKKEKRRDKKQKGKEHKEKSSRSRDLMNDEKQKECSKEAKNLLKGTKVEPEQVEKSGLTEEHGQPVWPQSPGYLSDGTQTNHKRKRGAASQPTEGCKLGKIIRIKLASSPSVSKEQSCSTSGRNDCFDRERDETSRGPFQQKTIFGNADTVVAVKDVASKAPIQEPRSVHSVKDIGLQGNVGALPRPKSSAESAYEALFEKWVPPPLQLEQLHTDDEEWLLGTRKQDGQATRTSAAFSPVPSCRSSSLWPRGQYLPDANVYSLPYTIPF